MKETPKETKNPKQEIKQPQPASDAKPPVQAKAEKQAEAKKQPEEQLDLKSGIIKQLEAAQTKCNDYEDRYLRSVADLDNFRKRAIREKEDIRRLANATLIEDLLPIMDNFALGLAAAQDQPEAKSITEGFALVSNQLTEVLKQNGVEELDPLGEPFDPNSHECVAQQASETVPEDHIIAVNRKGYLLNKRLLRPAHVLVSSGTASKNTKPEDNTKQQVGSEPPKKTESTSSQQG